MSGQPRSAPYPDGSPSRAPPLFVLVLPSAHQFPVDIGDLLQILFHSVIVLDPAADLLDLIAWHRATAPMRLIQGHAEIPYRAVPLPAGTLAIRIAAGQITLRQGTAKYLTQWGRTLVRPSRRFCKARSESFESLSLSAIWLQELYLQLPKLQMRISQMRICQLSH